MKKILIFAVNLLACIGIADGAVRDGTTSRTKTESKNQQIQSRVATTPGRTGVRSTTSGARAISSRGASKQTSARTGVITARAAVPSRTNATTQQQRPHTLNTARAATTTASALSTTNTGAAYEQCKNTYFSCMDQFCALKNDDYRRCSCNDRVFDLINRRQTLQDANEQLTVFTENLDVVGMTAAQAAATHTATAGENALTSDISASKALLQAIMNSIRGQDSTLTGKYSDLNSINLLSDNVNAFGMTDVGQTIASYNGRALYTAVYPQCRDAVRADCSDELLQRAVTAYLMAIEQDCNTVQTALNKSQQDIQSAIREGSAMLDLARIENRQKHNSSNLATCINEIEDAILSEQVCGANYHKCLDNGEFIDISTGAPIVGVENFYELEQLLVFSDGIDAADQKLSKNSSNRAFVQNFESRVKKFAQPALDKCVEDADIAWSEYLDRALLSIYYAQKSKVQEIKQGCFDYISACYMNGDSATTAAMSKLSGQDQIVLQPNKIALNTRVCTEFIESCNNMFDGNIIADYIENMQHTDTLAACRAVVQQCFDKYGGTNYENFYYPYSGLFTSGQALDWFTLYEYTNNQTNPETNADGNTAYVSPCAQQLQKIDACNEPEMIELAFGGLDKFTTTSTDPTTDSTKFTYIYGTHGTPDTDGKKPIKERYLRSAGVGTQVYNQILSILSTQCMNLQGRFMERQFIKPALYDQTNPCLFATDANKTYGTYITYYKLGTQEDVCPRDYGLGVDIQSWGACLCWENGSRRSKWGKSAKCVPVLPKNGASDADCSATDTDTADPTYTENDWCTQTTISGKNQVCPLNNKVNDDGYCTIKYGDNNEFPLNDFIGID